MKSYFVAIHRFLIMAFVLALTGPACWGEEPQNVSAASETISMAVDGEESLSEMILPEDLVEPRSASDIRILSEAAAGYRFIHNDDSGKRAAEYVYLRSNPEFSGLVNYLGLNDKFIMEGNFLNDKDYFGDISYDHKGIYRFQLRTESLFHNLDHERLFAPTPFTTSGGAQYSANDLDPAADFGLRVEQDLAKFRYKFPLYPLHLNFEYWRMVREGMTQQIFADHAFEGTENTVYSRSRRVSRETHEGNFVFDTHLGPVDLIYDFKIRQYGDHESTPRDPFVARDDARLVVRHEAALLPHDSTPENRFYSHTLKMHTSLSGGIIGAASYTFAKRENLSRLGDFKGADQTSDLMHNVAGDFTYTPCGFFSMALKYRHQEIDRDAPDSLTVTNPAYLTTSLAVRPAIDSVRDSLTATLSFLPIRALTIKSEYRGDFVTRENLGNWNRPGTTATVIIPENVNTHRGTLTMLVRPINGLRLKAQYSYSSADNAVYGNAFEQRHQGSLLATYVAPGRWGITANTRITREMSDHLSISTVDLTAPIVVATLRQPREKKTSTANLSLWFAPLNNLTLTGSYGLLRNRTDQNILFSGINADTNHPSSYTSQAQVFSLSAAYTPKERLDLSLLLQHVRSFSRFTPGFSDPGLIGDVQGITQTDTIENSLSARGEYSFTKNLSCIVDYVFRDFDEKLQRLDNGTSHSISAMVRAKW